MKFLNICDTASKLLNQFLEKMEIKGGDIRNREGVRWCYLNESNQRSLQRVGVIAELFAVKRYRHVRGAKVKYRLNGKARPVNKLYPLEAESSDEREEASNPLK